MVQSRAAMSPSTNCTRGYVVVHVCLIDCSLDVGCTMLLGLSWALWGVACRSPACVVGMRALGCLRFVWLLRCAPTCVDRIFVVCVALAYLSLFSRLHRPWWSEPRRQTCQVIRGKGRAMHRRLNSEESVGHSPLSTWTMQSGPEPQSPGEAGVNEWQIQASATCHMAVLPC